MSAPESGLARIDTARSLEPRDTTEALTVAATAAKSGLFPDLRTPEAAYVVLATGRELGLTAMQSLRSVYVVKGRPVVSADAMLAVVRASGLCDLWRTVESTDERCTLEARRKGDGESTTRTWSREDAKRAGLSGDTWTRYPRQMLRHRCTAELCRELWPDLLLGVYSEGEIPSERAPIVAEPALDHPPVPPSPPPAGSAWDEYRATVLGAGTVAEIRTAYAALPTALRLEGRDPATVVNDAGRLAGEAISRLGLAISSAGRHAILSIASETALDLLDELRELPAAVDPVASWWTGRVPRTLAQPDADLVLATAARWAAGMSAADGAGTKRALSALRTAIDAAGTREPGDESEVVA